MAWRARLNIEVIIERLTSAGYLFHSPDAIRARTPHIPSTPTAEEHAVWLEDRFGPVPMTVLSWVRIVGDVSLIGTHPQWPDLGSADPLVIELEGARHPGQQFRRHHKEDHDLWREEAAEQHEGEPYLLAVAPDLFHKQNVSGGGPYGFFVPDACADGLFRCQVTMPFVSYLNTVFRSGGFPGPTPTTDTDG
jgi:hypothetical protein